MRGRRGRSEPPKPGRSIARQGRCVSARELRPALGVVEQAVQEDERAAAAIPATDVEAPTVADQNIMGSRRPHGTKVGMLQRQLYLDRRPHYGFSLLITQLS